MKSDKKGIDNNERKFLLFLKIHKLEILLIIFGEEIRGVPLFKKFLVLEILDIDAAIYL